MIDRGARFVVVDDSEGTIRIDHPQFEVYTWADRRRMLGRLDVGYPRRNGASRDFGFYVAWRNSDPGEIVVALDDDCRVYHDDFHDRVHDVLSPRERPVVSCEGRHLNILDLYRDTPAPLFPRGFPYAARAGSTGIVVHPPESRNVTFGLGLWRGIFDVNAIDKIQGPEYRHPDATLGHPSVIIERGKLVSVCSMNICFRRELIPAVYQLPMHVEAMPGWVIDRYGDIWGGFILKLLMDRRNEAMAVGEPMIDHLKDGDYTRNIWQEHVGHLVNDEFVDLLCRVAGALESRDYLELMREVAEGLREHAGEASPLLRPYLEHLCTAMDAWNTSLS